MTTDVCQRHNWSMLAVAVGITMAVIDSAVANIALPTTAGGMLAVARLFGMAPGASLASAIFRISPRNAEFIELFGAAAFALVAGIFGLSRLHVSKSD